MEQNTGHEKLDYRKLDKVIALLDKAIPFAKNDKQLDMNEKTIFKHKEHECGSIHCFASWVYIAKYYIKGKEVVQPSKKWATVFDVDFMEGVTLIDRILELKLEIWAEKNFHIWKNENGRFVFGHKKAFINRDTSRTDGARSLFDIKDHLQDVSHTIRAIELKSF